MKGTMQVIFEYDTCSEIQTKGFRPFNVCFHMPYIYYSVAPSMKISLCEL